MKKNNFSIGVAEKQTTGLFQQAMRAYQTGQLEQAVNYFQQLLALNTEHADSMHLLGIIHGSQNQFAVALEWFAKAIVSGLYSTYLLAN